MTKYDDHLEFATKNVQTAISRFNYISIIMSHQNDNDILFFKQVVGAFVKEMILCVTQLFEKNMSTNMNLQKLLKLHLDSLDEKKHNRKINKYKQLLKEIKGVQFYKWKEMFEYRNGVIAHSDYEVYKKIKSKEKKFGKVMKEFTEAMNCAVKVMTHLVSNFEINTEDSERSLEEIDLTMRLIREHQEFVNIMREQEAEYFQNKSVISW